MKVVAPLIILVFASVGSLNAQKSFTIYYNTISIKSDSVVYKAGADLILAIKDSQSYTYYAFESIKFPIKYPLESSYIPKSTYFNVSKKLLIDPYGYLNKSRTYALLVYEVPQYRWVITNEKKIILGDTCIKAIGKNNDREIIAWYSPRLPAGFGIHHYVDLPGTVLESYMPDLNISTVAVKIENSSPDIIEPIYSRKVLGKTYRNRRSRTGNPKINWKEKDFVSE